MVKIKKSLFIKILIPIFIIISVVGIWIAKNKIQTTASLANLDLPLNVTEIIDLDELKSHKLPIIIDFGADSCIPCKEMAPVLKELNEEYQGKAIILFVDVWKYPDFSKGFPVSIIPTQILINSDGTPYIPLSDVLKENIKVYSEEETKKHTFTTHEGGLSKDKILLMLEEMGLEND